MTDPLDRFRSCPIGCGWTQESTEFDDEPGLRAARSQHLDRHSPHEIIAKLDEVTQLHAEVAAHEGEMGDLRASLSAADAEVDRLRADPKDQP